MPKKVVVIIHGAGDQPANYPEAEVDALAAKLGYRPAWLVARYDDIVKGLDWPRAGDEALKRWELGLRLQATQREALRAGRRMGQQSRVTLQSLPVGLWPTIQDCLKYLLADPAFQAAAQERLLAPLQKAAAEYDETILVSHSLGTVVSFDVLRQHAASCHVATWFTMGSPLRWLVGLKLHNGDLGQINAQTVRFWHNLYDTTDHVASPLAPAFAAYNLYDDFVEVSDQFPAAHHYWGHDETVGLIAEALR